MNKVLGRTIETFSCSFNDQLFEFNHKQYMTN